MEKERGDETAYVLDAIPKPSMTIDAIVNKMKQDNGLYDANLAQQVKWYLYHPDTDFKTKMSISEPGFVCRPIRKQLILQLLENLKDEVKVFLPEGQGKDGLGISVRGESYELIRNTHGFYRNIDETLYDKLYNMTSEWTPEYAYLLLTLAPVRECGYNRLEKFKDITMYLKVYETFKDSQAIRRIIRERFLNYPSAWKNDLVCNRILTKAGSEGADIAYQYYQRCFLENIHIHKYSTPNLSRQKSRFDVTIEFSGWPGSWITGALELENKTSDGSVIRLFGISKCHLIQHNGRDILEQCVVENEDLRLPVDVGFNKYEFKIQVNDDWWNFHGGN